MARAQPDDQPRLPPETPPLGPATEAESGEPEPLWAAYCVPEPRPAGWRSNLEDFAIRIVRGHRAPEPDSDPKPEADVHEAPPQSCAGYSARRDAIEPSTRTVAQRLAGFPTFEEPLPPGPVRAPRWPDADPEAVEDPVVAANRAARKGAATAKAENAQSKRADAAQADAPRAALQEQDDRDKGDGMTLVAPGVYLGAVWNATNVRELARADVRTIVCMAAELSRRPLQATHGYRNFGLEDDSREFALPALILAASELAPWAADDPSSPAYSPARRPVEESAPAPAGGGGTDASARGAVLVHCMMGRSRSPAAAAAHLMASRGWGAQQTVAYLRALRPCVAPNRGYLLQLGALETLLRALPLPILALVAQWLPPHGLPR